MAPAEEPKFALPTPKFMPAPVEPSVWRLLEPEPSAGPSELHFPFPPPLPEVPPVVATSLEPVLPCTPVLPSDSTDLEGLLAGNGGITGPPVQGEDFLQGPDSGDGLEDLVDYFADIEAVSVRSQDQVSEAEWYARADARDRSGNASRSSPSFEVVSLGLDRCELAGDSAMYARESVQPLPVWLASREADWDVRAHAVVSWAKRRRLEIPRLPWDKPKNVFQGAIEHFLGFEPRIGLKETLSASSREDFEVPGSVEIPWTVVRRLGRMRAVQCKDDIRNAAMKRLKVLILLDPEATKLGASLLKQTQELKEDEYIMQSLSDAFRKPASATLQKRALSLQSFAVKAYQLGFDSPWRLDEEQMYALFQTLRNEGVKASTAPHMLEALNFMHGIAVFVYMSLDTVVSSRTRGVARDLRLTKEPLRQRDPLSLERVQYLEELMQSSSSWLCCIVGQFLLCIHASVRWGDSQNIVRLEILGEGPGAILMASALGSKTTLTAEAKTRYLPYACVAEGVVQKPWAAKWLAAREEQKLTFEAGCLPTWRVSHGCWGDAAMSSEEASGILEELLVQGSLGPRTSESIGTHSFKATMISWSGWCACVPFTNNERRLMGHHVKRGSTSTLIYSRQYYINLCGKLLAMYQAIREGRFSPDQDVSHRVMSVAESLRPEVQVDKELARAEAQEQMPAEDSSVSGESEAEHVPPNVDPIQRVPFAGCSPDELRVHRLSGIVHRLKGVDFFWCGRPATGRYRDFTVDDQDEPETCLQCRRAADAEE